MTTKLPVLGSPSNSASSCSSGGINVAPVPGVQPAMMAEPGFAGNAALVTLGCAKNLVDSEIMLGVLRSKGFRPVSDATQADIIVVNTCAFLESAVKEGVDRILELSELKANGRCKRLVVAGCMVERYRESLAASLPEVDRFISTDELLTVADEGSSSSTAFDEARRPYFLYDESMPRIRSTGGHAAYVKIAEGCDRPCAFCIIPKIRGAFRSRPMDSIVREVRMLATEGVREISLVAQDLTAYGIDLEGSKRGTPQLEELVRQLDEIDAPSGLWIRLLYAYPIGVTESLVKTIVQSKNICSYLDLPLQHISNPVLKRMQRPLGERGTRGLIEQMRYAAPELAIRTTFVVGFPGETEEDIAALEQFVSEGHFAHVGVFCYSQEREAKAYTYPDQVPDELKEERRQRIMECQQHVVDESLESYIGSTERVLIEGLHSESDLLISARTEWQGPDDGEVIVNELPDEFIDELGERIDLERIAGRFGTVEITESMGYDLVGRLMSID